MFGLGPWELALTIGVILLVAGPTLLPRLGRSLGKSIKGLKESTETFGENLREEMEAKDAPEQLSDGVDATKEPAKDRA